MTERATPSLTREFLQGAGDKLVFEPQTLEEAEFIANQLLRFGFKYYNADYPNQLAQALTGSIYLDTDKTIMVSSGKAQGVAVSADGFDTFYMSPFDVAAARIKPQELLAGNFVFFPRSTTEARGLFAALKEAGATLEAEEGSFKLAGRAVYQGIIVRQGVIDFAPPPDELRTARIATPADLGVTASIALSAEQATMIAVFNEMAARLEQVNARVMRIEDEVLPKSIDKPRTLPAPK
ncbi:MAG TPA: hypothetical protein VEF76_09800 [Patescibacteria group bacterium]|nr:hypothetical protein [Patescibacteria group bacterium]